MNLCCWIYLEFFFFINLSHQTQKIKSTLWNLNLILKHLYLLVESRPVAIYRINSTRLSVFSTYEHFLSSVAHLWSYKTSQWAQWTNCRNPLIYWINFSGQTLINWDAVSMIYGNVPQRSGLCDGECAQSSLLPSAAGKQPSLGKQTHKAREEIIPDTASGHHTEHPQQQQFEITMDMLTRLIHSFLVSVLGARILNLQMPECERMKGWTKKQGYWM